MAKNASNSSGSRTEPDSARSQSRIELASSTNKSAEEERLDTENEGLAAPQNVTANLLDSEGKWLYVTVDNAKTQQKGAEILQDINLKIS